MVKTIRGHAWGTVVSVVRCQVYGITPTGAAVRYKSKSGKLEFSRTCLELGDLELSDRKKLSIRFLGWYLGIKKYFYFWSVRTVTSPINSILTRGVFSVSNFIGHQRQVGGVSGGGGSSPLFFSDSTRPHLVNVFGPKCFAFLRRFFQTVRTLGSRA